MKSIVLEEPGRFVLAETPPPGAARAGHAIVRVRRVGICGTDLHAYRGRQPFFAYPRILGHELGVEVVESGPGVEGIAPGDRCAVEPYLECGRCVACRRGRTNCCYDLRVLGVHVDGGMRERIEVPAAKLHRSKSLALEALALVETLGIGAHAVDRAALEEGEDVAVIGAGPIGLSVIQFAVLAGARVTLIERSAARAAFATRTFPIERVIDGGAGGGGTVDAAADTAARQARALGGELPTAVFDATGSGASMQAAFRLVAASGRLVFVGLFQGQVTFDDPDFHRRELTLLATRNSTAREFRRIIALMEEGRIDPAPWITHRAEPDTLAERFPGWLDPEAGVVKAMLEL